MMWGYGTNMGWMWLWGLILLIESPSSYLVAVRLFYRRWQLPAAPPGPAGPYPGRSRARLILDERFARGELSAEQYRDQPPVLGEDQ